MTDKFKEFKQAVFNRAYLGLKSQGFERSLAYLENEAEDGCAYRSGDGKACAIGYCIPDEKYSLALEGRSASYVLHAFSENLLGLLPEGASRFGGSFRPTDPHLEDDFDHLRSWLNELQAIHDDDAPRGVPRRVGAEFLKGQLDRFACDNNLSIPNGE